MPPRDLTPRRAQRPAGFASFQDLVKAREDWVRTTEENGFDFSELLTGIYDNPAHFLYELVQNAEDAGARRVEFRLDPTRLLVRHDGRRRFDLRDVEGVTGIGRSPKADDVTTIGRFGIGFKSVFAVTTAPEVRSGPYHFRVEQFVVPRVLSAGLDDDPWTEFVVPFDHSGPERSPENVYALVREVLISFGTDALLFLHRVRELSWRVGGERGAAARSEKSFKEVPGAALVHIKRSSGPSDRFFRFSHPSSVVDGRFDVSVAYRTERSGRSYRIVPDADTALSVHFPTGRRTGLRFRVNGPFQTTVNRADIPLKGNGANEVVLRELAGVARSSLTGLKALGLFTVGVLDVLPLAGRLGAGPVYDGVRAAIVAGLGQDGVLPTASGGFARAAEVALPADPRLPRLLPATELHGLFGRRRWLHPDMAASEAPTAFLTGVLGVPRVDVERLLDEATAGWLESRPDTWLVGLYDVARPLLKRTEYVIRGGRGGHRSIAEQYPLVRLESGTHVRPVDDTGAPLAYLPVGGVPPDLPVVRRTIADDREARAFLTALGVPTPSLLARVENVVVPQIEAGTDPPGVDPFDRFESVALAFREAGEDGRERLRKRLRGLRFIPGESDGQPCLVAADEAYFRRRDLVTFLGTVPGVRFASPLLRTSDEHVLSLLRALRLNEAPRRTLTPVPVPDDQRVRFIGPYGVREQRAENPSLEGLDPFLDAPDLPRSVALWRLLLRGLESPGYLKGAFSFTPYSVWRHFQFDSEALRRLRDTAWLYDVGGAAHTPGDVSLDDLAPEYNRSYPRVEDRVPSLARTLGLRPSAVDRLPDDDRQKYELTRDRSVAEVAEAMKLLDERRPVGADAEEAWEPDAEPGEEGEIVAFEPALPPDPTPPGQTKGGAGAGPGGRASRPKPNKRAGEWGEEHVFELLKSQYPDDEVFWLNQGGDQQTGYDIRVERKGEPIEYAEVKSSVGDGTVAALLSGPQWTFASALSLSGRGDQYVLYVVPRAGSAGARAIRVVDPVGQWRSGRLRVISVELEVRAASIGPEAEVPNPVDDTIIDDAPR